MLFYIYIYLFGFFVVVVFNQKFVFLSFSLPFWWSIKIPQQNVNQSETGIGDNRFSVELYRRQSYKECSTKLGQNTKIIIEPCHFLIDVGLDMDTEFFSMKMLMFIRNKQHSNIWSWIYGKVKQHWGWVERQRIKKRERRI